MPAYIPQAFRDASATSAERDSKVQASSDKVEARINMSAEVAGKGLCPECREPMVPGLIGDTKVQYCLAHRIALPIPDETPGDAEAGLDIPAASPADPTNNTQTGGS